MRQKQKQEKQEGKSQGASSDGGVAAMVDSDGLGGGRGEGGEGGRKVYVCRRGVWGHGGKGVGWDKASAKNAQPALFRRGFFSGCRLFRGLNAFMNAARARMPESACCGTIFCCCLCFAPFFFSLSLN